MEIELGLNGLAAGALFCIADFARCTKTPCTKYPNGAGVDTKRGEMLLSVEKQDSRLSC